MPNPTKAQTLYSEQIADRIVECVGKGLSRKDAAAMVGITWRTLYTWLDEESPTFKPTLLQRVLEADAGAVLMATTALQRAIAQDNVKAITLWLQAKRSEEWGQKSRLELTNADGQTFNTTTLTPDALKGLTDDELKQFIALQDKIAKQASPGAGTC